MLQRVIGFGLVFTVAVFLFGGVLTEFSGTANFLSTTFDSSKHMKENVLERKSKKTENDNGGSEQNKFFDVGSGFHYVSANLSPEQKVSQKSFENLIQCHSDMFKIYPGAFRCSFKSDEFKNQSFKKSSSRVKNNGLTKLTATSATNTKKRGRLNKTSIF